MKEKESIFSILNRIKEGEYSIEDYLVDTGKGSEDLALYQRTGEPRDNIGDRIMEEADERFGFLELWENRLALDYFDVDYGTSLDVAEEYIDTALSETHHSKSQRSFLEMALNLVKRADIDLKKSFEISPLTRGFLHDNPLEIYTQDIQEQREKIWIASKYPVAYHLILPLHLRKKKAIQEENYELARELDSQINQSKRIPRMIASYEEMRRDVDLIYSELE